MAETVEHLVRDLTELEWELFQRVHNEGGQAHCQTQGNTFSIMRASQLKTWPLSVLLSYENDLLIALGQGRNLLAEKYGHMMRFTSPEGYEQLKERLPQVDGDTLGLIEEMVAINLEWERLLDQQYPALRERGRPRAAEQDSEDVTSVETYLRGELMTYSPQTIQLLHQYTLQAQAAGHNLALENLTHMVHAYGYESLESAERAFKR